MIRMLLHVSDSLDADNDWSRWFAIVIIVSHLCAVSILVLWVGLETSKYVPKLQCDKSQYQMEMEMLQGTYLPACYDQTQYRSLTFVLQTLDDEGDTSLLVPVLPEYDLMHLPALAYQFCPVRRTVGNTSIIPIPLTFFWFRLLV
jgi:hypothetical protein